MHTTQEWHRNTTVNVTQAHKSHVLASTQAARSHRAHDATATLNFSATENLHVSLREKVGTSHRLVDRLRSRAASLQHSVAETHQSLGMLQAALRAKDTPLQLCAWRLAQRERRPMREQVRDYVELALEAEKGAILSGQRRLRDAAETTRNAITALERKIGQVTEDVDLKEAALHADEVCLRTTQRSLLERAQSAGTSSPPSGRYRPKGAAHQITDRNEEIRLQDAARLDMSAIRQELNAKATREHNTQLVAAVESAVRAAASKSVASLQERIHEEKAMQRKLEASVRQTQVDMRRTRNTMLETRQEIKSLQEPIAMCSTVTSVRKVRPSREHIVDPVSTQLREHKVALLKSNEALRSHHESEKAVLQDLADRLAQLKADYKDKSVALQIDVMCLTHDTKYPEAGGPTAPPSHGSTPRSRSLERLATPRSCGQHGRGFEKTATPARGDGHYSHAHRYLNRPSTSCGASSRVSVPMPMTVR